MYNEELIKEALSKDSFYKKDINTCITLQDKLRWLNVNNISDEKIICADKIAVKDYVLNTIGKDIYTKVYNIYKSVDEIKVSELPRKFIMKINNGCSKNIFCFDKNNFDLNKYKDTLKDWLSKTPGLTTREYQYTGIEPKIFTEELLINSKEESLIDYRLWCFNNKVQLISVNNGHGWGATSYFDKDFKYMDVVNSANHHSFTSKENIFEKPLNFELMKTYAEQLSKPFKFVRVDMYNINGKIYLGEMSFSPGGYCFHLNKWDGTSLDEYYGNLLKI